MRVYQGMTSKIERGGNIMGSVRVIYQYKISCRYSIALLHMDIGQIVLDTYIWIEDALLRHSTPLKYWHIHCLW